MTVKERISQGFLWFFLLVMLLIFVIPYIFMISNSFEEFSYTLPYPPRFLPSGFSLEAYRHVLGNQTIVPAFVNSTIITSVTVALGLFVSSLSAYAFAKIDFIGRETLFKIYLFTLMIPGFMNLIPQTIILRNIQIPLLFPNGMIGTRSGLILLYVSTAICGNTFFLRNFFKNVPNELLEAVRIDGGGHRHIYFQMILPLSKPAIATMAIMAIQGTWEEYLSAKVILGGNEALLTLPLMLQRLHGQHATRWEWVFAASLLMQIPILILFVVFQKRFVIGGITQGAIKA